MLGRLLLAAALLLLVSPGVAAAQDQPQLPALPQSAEIGLKVERNGALSVTEAVSVPENAMMTRTIGLRVPDEHHRDRVYGVRDVVVQGNGTGSVTDDAFTVRLSQGVSVVRYTVDGAVSVRDGVEDVTWPLASGWDTELKYLRATFAAPRIPDAVDCVAGPAGSDFHCGAAQMDHSGLTRFSQQNLPAGQTMTITVELPAGTVPADERLVPSATVAGAFVVTAPVGWAWAGFGALVLAAAVAVGRARRRATYPGAPEAAGLVSGDGEFVSPEGVLPGHAGVVLTGRAGPVDLAATVLDLAVRNYLWVSAEDDGWRLTRRNPADEHLRPFEDAVFAAILPDDAQSVTLAELRARPGFGPATEALHAEAVRLGWLAHSPEKHLGRLGRAGIRVIFYGVFLTVLLALTVGYAQLGVLLSLAGALAVTTSWLLPNRRHASVALTRRLRGLAVRLAEPDPDGLTEHELVFSRALPYALALGELGRWVAAFDDLEHPPPVYWHGGEDVTPGHAGAFAFALAGTFAGTRRARLPGVAALT